MSVAAIDVAAGAIFNRMLVQIGVPKTSGNQVRYSLNAPDLSQSIKRPHAKPARWPARLESCMLQSELRVSTTAF
jgi:hypothetical protein